MLVGSDSQVRLISDATYRYNAKGSIASVVPNRVPANVVTRVTITGESALCDGSDDDVLSVLLAGVPAKISSVARMTIVVEAQKSLHVHTSDVVVISKAYGTTVATNAFSYYDPEKQSTANGMLIGAVVAGVTLAVGATIFGLRNRKHSVKSGLLLRDNDDYHNLTPSQTQYGAISQPEHAVIITQEDPDDVM